MQLNPYLSFNGNCEEAFNFYAKVFGAKIEAMIRGGETPMAEQIPQDRRDKIMHARLSVGGTLLMASDTAGEHYKKSEGIMVTINIEKPAEAERVFKELAAGGKVEMALQETFWAQRFGMLTDRFGTPWMINCERPLQ
ncbi:MAG TPA: VOC family protein [Spongiibacteraceae bacterium]